MKTNMYLSRFDYVYLVYSMVILLCVCVCVCVNIAIVKYNVQKRIRKVGCRLFLTAAYLVFKQLI